MTMQSETRQTLVSAADLVTGANDPESGGLGPEFLKWLGVTPELDEADRRDLANLLRFAAGLDRLFELPVPDAPGLACFGASVSVAAYGAKVNAGTSVSGVGPSRLAAFRACVAEACEFASQFEIPEDARVRIVEPDSVSPGSIDDCEFQELHGGNSVNPTDWVEAVRLPNRSRDAVPADLCWRRSGGRRPNGLPYLMGIGVAAGRTREEAAYRAILEWAERDAVALWWRGGRRPGAVDLETLASSGVVELLKHYRQGRTERRSWFLNLTNDVGIPVAAALSSDRDGAGVAYGFAAGGSMEEALRGAIEELLQIELADRVVAAKRAERGDEGLNETDRKHVARAGMVRGDWLNLQPVCIAPHETLSPVDDDQDNRLNLLATRLGSRGHAVRIIDLTRPDFDIPVARAIVTGLQPDPSELVSKRLSHQRALAVTGEIPGDRVELY
ncbi:YcaO-like family protein [Rhizobiales bacterium]|uniref:YcaO-like family protein n=1 Tax=Hongsoonwoonella zoysiae TaxID=2821844 RepID=UPI001560CDC9|nr:YcaO-like family protein [Hongsoonwoonella zoysiae]NRG19475.1 YcaO-like family protein [Hongsoonwoonella zoysiae]